MKIRTSKTTFDSESLTWRTLFAIPITMLAVPFSLIGNGLLIISSVIGGRNISYSFETDVETEAARPAATVPGDGQ